MSRWRWRQFSLRFLFLATFVAAYRPGIVKPEFSFDGLICGKAYTLDLEDEIPSTHEVDTVSARIRVTNGGPDTIFVWDKSMCWLPEYRDAQRNAEQNGIPSFRMWSPNQEKGFFKPARVRPGKFMTLDVSLGDDVQSVALAVPISDRRGGKSSSYWSQNFAIADNAHHAPRERPTGR